MLHLQARPPEGSFRSLIKGLQKLINTFLALESPPVGLLKTVCKLKRRVLSVSYETRSGETGKEVRG